MIDPKQMKDAAEAWAVLLAPVIIAVSTIFQHRNAKQSAKERKVLQAGHDAIQKQVEQVRVLVNGRSCQDARTIAMLARRVAELSHAPADIAAADAAEQTADHLDAVAAAENQNI